MPSTRRARRQRPSLPVISALLLMGMLALPASAQFITTDRTVANGNALNGIYFGQTVWVGISGVANGVVSRVADVQVDVIEPAVFSYGDQTGGGLAAYSNSQLRIVGGTFAQHSANGFGGYVNLNDTSNGVISGGSLRGLSLSGAAPGAAGATATVNGGVIQNGIGGVAYIVNGTLTVNGGTLRAQGGNSAIANGPGGVIGLRGGLVESVAGSAVYLDSDGGFTMTGGTVTGGPGGGAQWGVRLQGVTTTAVLHGGTVNGGLRADAANNVTSPQATLGGNLALNGGVFAYGNAAVDVTGGSYSRFAGADASFFALGTNTVNFFGTDLALSAATPGQIFETNHYVGNFYTFVSGSFADGQSAVGMRLFDAVSVAGNPLSGGFTLNAAPVPEPASWLLMLLALPAMGAIARRRS